MMPSLPFSFLYSVMRLSALAWAISGGPFHSVLAELPTLLEQKTEHENLEAQFKKDAIQFRKQSKAVQGELSEVLFTLAIACDEAAGVHDKMADFIGDQHPSDTLIYEQQLKVVMDKIDVLKSRATALGYKDEDAPDADEDQGTNSNASASTATTNSHSNAGSKIVVGDNDFESDLMKQTNEQKRLSMEFKKKAEDYKTAAQKEKSELSVTLYGLSQACSEKALVHDKLSQTFGQRQPDIRLGLEKQLATINQRFKSLKQKAEELGYKDSGSR